MNDSLILSSFGVFVDQIKEERFLEDDGKNIKIRLIVFDSSFIKDDVFNLETITDINVAMELLSQYEDLKFRVRQYEYKERKNKIYLDSIEELLGHKNMISLNVYYDDVF